MTSLQNFWQLLNNNAGAVGVVLTVFSLVVAAYRYLHVARSKKSSVPNLTGLGGAGGNATVSGNGLALGGNGGRAGLGGVGGKGGDAKIAGNGLAVGGTGGDTGVPWRPALGGSSTAERLLSKRPEDWDLLPKDEYGFIEVGRGGFGAFHTSRLNIGGEYLPIEPLLRFLNYWAPEVIDAADRSKPQSVEAFWEAVRRSNPAAASAAESHVAQCVNETIPNRTSPPNPYLDHWKLT